MANNIYLQSSPLVLGKSTKSFFCGPKHPIKQMAGRDKARQILAHPLNFTFSRDFYCFGFGSKLARLGLGEVQRLVQSPEAAFFSGNKICDKIKQVALYFCLHILDVWLFSIITCCCMSGRSQGNSRVKDTAFSEECHIVSSHRTGTMTRTFTHK